MIINIPLKLIRHSVGFSEQGNPGQWRDLST